jgi:hypothetical protein
MIGLCAAALMALSAAPASAQTPKPLHPLAERHVGRTIVLFVPDNVAVPFVLNPNGTMTYTDVHIGEEGVKDSYVRTLPFEIRQDKTLCVLKPENVQECFDFMPLTVNTPRTVNVTSYENGKAAWSGKGELMLLIHK